ncbi:hypothetical protein ACIBBE_23910 [Streptomyces sp. NPDC051644]|uniref:hypothetical protein n=1 Tax=Streptomyces sp. NPDC051644 TaxID=3365666 RepID=UPI00378938D3
MNDPMTVNLRNGGQAARPVVQTTLMTLEMLHTQRPSALRELALLAADPTYDPDAEDLQFLTHLRMVGNHLIMHDSTRDIVRSAVEVDGDDIRLVDPAVR